MKRLPWPMYFMAITKLVAIRSGCNSRPTGAVIVKNNRVISTGYNGSLPEKPQCTDRGDNFCLRRSLKVDDKGEKKYQECPSIHAEQNAINQIPLTGQGQSLKGATLYCTLEPCIICLKNIASVGIKKVYYEIPYYSDDEKRDLYWKEKAIEWGVETEQLELTDTEAQAICSMIIGKTSIRRILR